MPSIEQPDDPNQPRNAISTFGMGTIQIPRELGSVFNEQVDEALCAHCRAVLDHWADFLRDNRYQVPHYGLMSEIEASAIDGCSLRTQFIRAAQIHSYRKSRPSRVKPEKTGSTSPNLPKGYVTMTASGAGHGRLEQVYRLYLSTLEISIFLLCLSNRSFWRYASIEILKVAII